MRDVVNFLMTNYFPKYRGNMNITPNPDELANGLELYKDNLIVLTNGEVIIGVAFYLTLCDDTYNAMGCIDITNEKAMADLLKEHGDNIHFILVCGSSVKNIMAGIKKVKKQRKPKSISWWSPDMTRLHKYNLN